MNDINKLYTEYDIQALIDNELSWEDEKHVCEFIQTNRHALKRYEELRKQKILLKNWFNTVHKE